MSLKLSKGSSLNLGKTAPNLKNIGIGLGWDPNETPGGPNFDLDVSAFLLTPNGKVYSDQFVVFYNSELKTTEGRPYSYDSSVLGAVDAIDGTESDGEDDEDMRIFLDKVWEGVDEIVITVSITKYPNDKFKDQRTLSLNFGMVSDCYIRCWNDETQAEIFRYDLTEKFGNEDALVFGKFKRSGASWEFIASGEGLIGGLGALAERYM
jgi:tellurium resistance protein TerD